MNRNEMITYLHKQIGAEGLTDLVKQGKITLDEYKTVVGIECEIDAETLRANIREKVREYKWTKSATPFMYDGYLQQNLERDRSMMDDCYTALSLGLMESIEWKLPDETRKTITDASYFIQMKATSTLIIQQCFGIEEVIVTELDALTDEEVKEYDAITRFDTMFEEYITVLNEANTKEETEEEVIEEASAEEETTTENEEVVTDEEPIE